MTMKTYHPVDHGFAWVICFATGVQAFFVVGGLKSMGILFLSLVEIFDAPPSLTALTLGLVAGGFALFALLSSAASGILGYREVTLFGAVLLVFSAFMAMWAMNIAYTIVFLGALSGLAFGAMGTPAIVLLNMYFDKRKSLANGIAMVGSSIGQLSLPYLITFFIDEYGFRGAMLLYTGICMQAIPAAMLLWPTTFWIPKSKRGGGQSNPHETMVEVNREPSVSVESRNGVGGVSGSLSSLRPLGRSHYSSTGGSRHVSLAGSRTSLDRTKQSTMYQSTGSIMLGLSIENLADASRAEEEDAAAKKRKPNFCRILFDRDLLKSPVMWMLFCSVGIGHAGFIDACLYLPSLAYDLFGSKYKGAFLIFLIGAFDIVGRVGGGAFADTGLISRTHLTALAMGITGAASTFLMFAPRFEVLGFYSAIMGMVGGIYRILLPVLVRDLFGPTKMNAGVGLGYLSMGVFILPMPTILSLLKEVYGSYIPAMMLCGALLMLGALLMSLIPLVKAAYDKRSQAPATVDTGDSHPEQVSLVAMGTQSGKGSPVAVDSESPTGSLKTTSKGELQRAEAETSNNKLEVEPRA